MAKVFADDVTLEYNGTGQFLAFLGTTVYDAGGNNNGHLDPGETVDLTATLKNIGGVNFNTLNTTLSCSDPHITINDYTGYFGSLAVNETKENTSDPYNLSVASNTPQGHIVQFRIIANEGAFQDTFDVNLVVGTYHYLVWNPDPTPTPGQAMHSILSGLGYSGVYTTTLPTGSELDMYKAVLVCVGIYPNNYVIGSSSSEAAALVDFLQNQGGRMYLEGGDVWYYDPPTGYDFGPLFGINATDDGSSDMGPVVGQSGTFTVGMNFAYGGENSWMDHISPVGTGFLVFVDGDNSYDCGVANDAGTYRTVGTSFELGALTDAGGASTRAALLDSIMHFFGIFVVGVDEHTNEPLPVTTLHCTPNPCVHSMNIDFKSPASSDIRIRIYDATGRVVKEYHDLGSLNRTITWQGEDNAGRSVPSGLYFVRIDSSYGSAVEKVVLLE